MSQSKSRVQPVKKPPRRRPAMGPRVSFRIDQDQLSALEQYAYRQGVSVAFVVRHLVNRFLDHQRGSASRPSASTFPGGLV